MDLAIQWSDSTYQQFLNSINNWAVCDSFCSSLKFVKKEKKEMLLLIQQCLMSEKEYIVRFGFVMLMHYYMEEPYLNIIFDACANMEDEAYYITMAKAWLLSVCYVKKEKETMEFLEQGKLSKRTYQKTLQKIIESNRVTKEQKEQIRQKRLNG